MSVGRFSGQPYFLHFKAINLLLVRFSNLESMGSTQGILHTQSTSIRSWDHFSTSNPASCVGETGSELNKIRQKKASCFVSYPAGDMRCCRACFSPPSLTPSRLDIKQQSRRCRRCTRLLRRGACEQKRRHGREPRRDRFSRRCAAPGGDVTV